MTSSGDRPTAETANEWVYVRIKRCEGYEDVADDLVMSDMIANPDPWEIELCQPPNRPIANTASGRDMAARDWRHANTQPIGNIDHLADVAFKAGWDARDEEVKRLQAEVERRTREVELCYGVQNRLREALEEIASLSAKSGRKIDDYGNIARLALKALGHDGGETTNG